MRLSVDGDRIVEADAPGMARPLAGLTLLEAAAVPGETLAADALANALAQVFRADRDPDRIAVAMSGGVDSAVALLRAGPKAIGVTLRLWLDPAGPDSERACCSPEAVIAARETCHALGLPHVTLDLRDEFRRAVVDPFVASYARGETPNPCGRCNGEFRFAELLDFAERAGAVPPLDRPLRADRRARRPPAPRPRGRSGQGPVVHARAARPGAARPDRVPARRADEDGDAQRGGRCRAGSRGAPREPGGVLPRRRRLPRVPRAAGARGRGRRDRGRGRRRARPPRGRLALHTGPAPRNRRRRGRAALRTARRTQPRTRSSSARAARSPVRPSRCKASSTRRPRTSRPSCATAPRRCRRA